MSTRTNSFDGADENRAGQRVGADEAPYDDPETTGRDRQPVSVMHLVMGLVFLGIAGAWGLRAAGVIESVDVQLLIPLVLVVAGAAGLLASVVRGVRH